MWHKVESPHLGVEHCGRVLSGVEGMCRVTVGGYVGFVWGGVFGNHQELRFEKCYSQTILHICFMHYIDKIGLERGKKNMHTKGHLSLAFH